MERKTKNLIIVLIVLVLILVLSLGAVLLLGGRLTRSAPPATSGSGVGLTIDKDAGEYVEQKKESVPGVAIPGWASLTLPADTTKIKGSVDFYNPEANEGWYYLTYELRLPDSSAQGYEVLYTSGLIEPGKHIQSITLSRGLPAGEYDAVIHVQPYTLDEEMTPLNNADLKTTLVVK